MIKNFTVLCPFLGTFLLLSPLFAASPTTDATVASEADVDYGEMYVVQKRENVRGPWSAAVNYSYGFSNPYLSIHGVQLDLQRRMTDHFSLGISPTFFESSEKALTSQMVDQLGVQGVQTQIYQPRYAAHVVAELIPLSGMLNWFSSTAVDFDFVITFGAGLVRYRQQDRAVASFRVGALPQVMLTRALGLSAGIQASFEHLAENDWQNRIETLVGVVGRF